MIGIALRYAMVEWISARLDEPGGRRRIVGYVESLAPALADTVREALEEIATLPEADRRRRLHELLEATQAP